MRSKYRKIYILQIIAVLPLFFIGCKKDIEFSDDTYFGGKVMILGHRGMGELYKMPGNTFEAIAPVIAIGADGCEVDIQMTKDSVLVLYHDPTLNARTTCTGRVYESTWDEIRQCKYYALQNMIFVNSVDSIFSKLPGLSQLYFSFDCKVDTMLSKDTVYQDQYLRAIKRLCDKFNMTDNVFLEGEFTLLLRAKKIGLTNRLFLFGYLNAGTINAAVNNGFFGISTTNEWMELTMEEVHEKGLYVMLWSPDNDTENKEALKMGADIIQTDDPMTILKLLDRFNYNYVIP